MRTNLPLAVELACSCHSSPHLRAIRHFLGSKPFHLCEHFRIKLDPFNRMFEIHPCFAIRRPYKQTKIIHTAVATAANVADSTVLPDLLHGEETRVWGDQAYRGQSAVIRACAPQAQDCTHRRYRYKDGVDEVERAKNRSKSTVRSKVEHVFAVMKLKFGFVKLRYRGLKKNATQLFAVCALVNLYLARKKLLLLAPA